METYTAVVIGAGPAGHTCAVRLAQLGAKVAVVERDYVGGICTNWGCTPSKSMIEAAKIARVVKHSSRYGVNTSAMMVDFKQVAERRDQIILESRQAITRLLKKHNVDIYYGEAEVVSPGQVRVRKGKLDLEGTTMHYTGESDEIFADNIVLATGSHPVTPPFVQPDDPFIVSSNRLISIGVLPESLIIVGGGVIGLEFATIFSNLGSQVTVVEMQDRVLATLDPDISAEITHEMEQNGVRVMTSVEVQCIEDGVLVGRKAGSHNRVEVRSEAILIAIGRTPVIDRAVFDRVGIAYTKSGITVDSTMRTNVPGIWSIGDATGKSILAHVGIQQGIICAENIMQAHGETPREMDYSVVPAAVYTIPEVYAVGTVPSDLTGIQVVKVPFSINLRARIEGNEEGFIKLWIRDDRILAAQAIGHNVSELMQEITNMIALGTSIEAVAEVIHAHPTYSEITRSIMEYSLGRPVDFSL